MQNTNKKKRIAILSLGILFLILILGYFIGFFYFSSRFLPGTSLNGVDASGDTVSSLKEKLQEYELTVQELQADGSTMEEKIAGRAVGLELSNEDALKDILNEQSSALWFLPSSNQQSGLEIVSWDEQALEESVKNIQGFQRDDIQSPQDAYVSDYDEQNGYEIVSEIVGNTLNYDKTLETIRDAVCTMQESISLEKADCYEKPAVTSEDEKLQKSLKKLNKYAGVIITYKFGENREVLDGSIISQWLKVVNGNVRIDKDKLAEYIAGLRKKYDTIFSTRKFKTSYGKKVTIVGGDYGWWMNYTEEAKQLLKKIKNGKSGNRTPVYYQTAESYGSTDYGDTYVEINLTAQHMFFIKNGRKILESDFVSGNPTYGNATPDGVYGITYKERDATLDGENYSTPVSYWMPFNHNIGLHDATWRNQFGGNIYKSSGSHGCINLPYDVAKKLFDYVEQGTPVVCYELAGTENK